jgi:hypothetical protein
MFSTYPIALMLVDVIILGAVIVETTQFMIS